MFRSRTFHYRRTFGRVGFSRRLRQDIPQHQHHFHSSFHARAAHQYVRELVQTILPGPMGKIIGKSIVCKCAFTSFCQFDSEQLLTLCDSIQASCFLFLQNLFDLFTVVASLLALLSDIDLSTVR
jgi:hypothetical protein